MIKRPFILILCSYMFGMFLAWKSVVLFLVLFIMLLFAVVIYLFQYRIRNHWITTRDKFLWCLPFLLILGFLSMQGQLTRPELDRVFGQKLSCNVSGTISMIVQKQSSKAIYLKNATVLLEEKKYRCESIIIYCTNQKKGSYQPDVSLQKSYLVGNKITVYGSLQKFTTASNPGQFNEKLYYQIENVDYKMLAEHIKITDERYSRFHAALDVVKQKLLVVYEQILTEKEAGTLIAMILGEKYLINDEVKQLYQMNGISHIIAISGLHISLIGMFVFHMLKKIKLPIPVATFCSIFIIYSYGVLTDFSVSTNRAVVMMTVMLLAALFGKTYDMLSSLALSAFLILLQNPLQIVSAGFLLSFGAVLGITVIYPALQKLCSSKNTIVSSVYISYSAQISTTPAVIYYYYQFPLYSLITNLIILPFVTILTLTSILAGIAGVIWLPLGIFLIGASNYILKFYEWICRMGAALPYHLVTVGKPDIVRIVIYLCIVALFLWLAFHKENKLIMLLPVLALVILMLPQSKGGLAVTMLDVGQGDGIVVQSEEGKTYLLDGGSSDVKNVGRYRIQPYLLSKGIDQIDYAIVSHSDNDHISGLIDLILEKRISIKTLILPMINEKDSAYLDLEKLANEEGIKTQYIRRGDSIRDGALIFTCLHPCKNYTPSSINAYSTVLRLKYYNFDMLFTGDLEKDGEELVTELLSVGDNDMDVLKVAHHGSKYSTSQEFLSQIKPEISLISCGENNSYGHPNMELLERVRSAGCKTMITYEKGAILLKTDGKKLEVEGYKE